jgi:putative inorganic carbon (HCO3(-)) transporter
MKRSKTSRSFQLASLEPEAFERSKASTREALESCLLVFTALFVLSPLFSFFYAGDIVGALLWKSVTATTVGFVLWVLLAVLWMLRPLDTEKPTTLSPFLPLMFFLLWGLLAALLSPYPSTAFLGNFVRHEGWVQYVAYAGVFAASRHLSRRGSWPTVRTLWLSVAIAAALVGLLERGGILPFEWSLSFYGTSFFINRNHFGYFLSITVVLSASLWTLPLSPAIAGVHQSGHRLLRFAAPALTVLLISAIAYTLTRGAWIAVFLGLLIQGAVFAFARFHGAAPSPRTVLQRLRPFAPFGAAVLVFAGLFSFDPALSPDRIRSILADLGALLADPASKDALGSGTFRWLLWVEGAKLVTTSPWFGFGPDTSGILLEKAGVIVSDRVHNEYLQYSISIGIPGLLAWVTFLVFALRRVFLPEKAFAGGHPGIVSPEAIAAACAAFTYLVSAFFGNSLTYVAPFLFLLLGRAAAGRGNSQD